MSLAHGSRGFLKGFVDLTIDGHLTLGDDQRVRLDDDADTYILSDSDDIGRLYAGGANAFVWGTFSLTSLVPHGFPAGSAAVPNIRNNGGATTGIFWPAATSVGVTCGGAEKLRVDADATARNTALLVYDVDNATLERVSVGDAESGGAGFKLLRIPN